MRRRVVASLALLSGLVSPVASAQGFLVNRLEPSERGSDWFVGESLDFRGSFRPAVGILGDYSVRPLVIYDAAGNIQSSVVRNNFVTHLGGSFVLFERARLGLSVPVQLFADGRSGTVGTTALPPPPREQGMGDMRLSLDFRLLGEYGDAFTAALGANLWLPTGEKEQYMSDGELRVRPRVAVAGDVGSIAYSAQVGFMARNPNASGYGLGNEMTFAATVGLKAADGRLTVGPEVFGNTSLDDAFGKRTTPVEGVLGAHYLISDDVRIGAGVGSGLTRGFGAPQVRVLAGIEWHPGVVTDRDGDGILDKDDACPDKHGPRSEEPTKNGCPLPPPPKPQDRDGDGVVDADDACVDVAGVATSDPKTNGCPPDRDHDGIVDAQDACPDDNGPKNDDLKWNGCPDSDGDGVFDKEDACSKEPGQKTSDPKTNGCPDPDRDKDGIANDKDACPDAPGKPDPDPKRNGCPKAFVEGTTIRILDQVKFQTGSAQILPGKDSQEVLQAVLKILKEHTDIAKVRVEGHTDNRGQKAYNKKLSGDRAASVVAWLVKNGIAKERLASAGFGDEKPVDTNDTEPGRKNNRRVEFHIENDKAGDAPKGADKDAPKPKP